MEDKMVPGFWRAYKQGGILEGFPFADKVFYVGAGAPRYARQATTIQAALNNLADRDTLMIGPGSYDEEVVWPIGLSNVTVIGAGNRGDVSIAPSGSNKTALKIEGNATRTEGITLINIGCE
ncbi:MAG: hypothetical protein ACRD8Z_26185, partial [Nitrososphaeraceae archaeon]